MIRVRVIVSGLVQGVYFRDGCRRLAFAQGVDGWVRNLPDGRVEAVFEGARDSVEAMVDWTRHGPPRASVDGVEVREEAPEGLGGFTVR
jgi:acylphosphatase